MTFKELNEKMGGGESESDWRRARGGGWIHKSAAVDNDKNIKDDARVYGNARVSGNAQVSGDARVYGDARVSGDAWVSGNAWVYGNARVSGGEWVRPPLFIVGSRFSLTNAKPGYLQIGCQCHTFSEWRKVGPELATRNNFTPEEIAEYAAYLDLFEKIGK